MLDDCRRIDIKRPNWLFIDTVTGGSAGANMYSLVRAREADSNEPYQYLIALIKGLPHTHIADDHEALLPW